MQIKSGAQRAGVLHQTLRDHRAEKVTVWPQPGAGPWFDALGDTHSAHNHIASALVHSGEQGFGGGIALAAQVFEQTAARVQRVGLGLAPREIGRASCRERVCLAV